MEIRTHASMVIGSANIDGIMDEEYLFSNNQSYMKQIGLAP